MRFLFNYIVVLVFLLFGLFHKACLEKWSNFHDGCYTSNGRLSVMSDISLSRCTAECFVNTKCEVFGYGSFGKNCYLYDGTFSTSTTQSCSSGSSSSISYYRVACGQLSDYTYVTSLKKCISYKSDERMVWEDARDVCINDGGHLVYVTSQEILDYIDSHRESSITKYWVGGVQTEIGSTIYEWLSGKKIDSTNGGQLWLAGRPNLDGRNTKLCIETKYSSDKTNYGLFDRNCSSLRKFFCEIDNF